MATKALMLEKGWVSPEMGQCFVVANKQTAMIEFYGRSKTPALTIPFPTWIHINHSVKLAIKHPDYAGRKFQIGDAFPAEQGYGAVQCDIATILPRRVLEFRRLDELVIEMNFVDVLNIQLLAMGSEIL